MKFDYTKCPDCKDPFVMGMKTGNVHVFGCLNCKNAQGVHRTLTEAKKAWKTYVLSKESK